MKLKKQFSPTTNLAVLEKVVRCWAKEINSPTSIALLHLFEAALSGDNDALGQLKEFTVDPHNYTENQQMKFMLDFQLCWFVQTLPNYPGSGPEARKQRTLEKFLATEQRCKETDQRYFSDLNSGVKEVTLFDKHMRMLFCRIFEGFDPSKLSLRHGPGACIGASSAENELLTKHTKLTCSTNAFFYWLSLCSLAEMGQLEDVSFVDKQQLNIDVYKNAFENRAITTQPIGDAQIQLALLDWLFEVPFRRVLKMYIRPRQGELSPAQVNGLRVRLGAKHGNIACLDGSSAGQHITYKTVMHWCSDCPDEVKNFISACTQRTLTLPDGSTIELHKFAMAGNGLEWAIQCIVYYGVLSFCIPSGDFGINGDDWTVPTWAYKRSMLWLTYIGQKMNEKKSFNTSGFREASGTDAFFDTLCLKTKAKDINEESTGYLISLHNSLYRIFGGNDRDDAYFPRVTEIIRKHGKHIPNIPITLGDGGFHRPNASCKGGTKDGIRYFKVVQKSVMPYKSPFEGGVEDELAPVLQMTATQMALSYGSLRPNGRRNPWQLTITTSPLS